MKSFALVALFVAGAAANYGYSGVASSPGVSSYSTYGGAVPSRSFIPITRFNHDIQGSDSSSLTFESGNGIKQSDSTQVVQGRGGSYEGENGQMVKSISSITKTGEVSYTSPEGTPVHLSWIADDQGFRPVGSHLPTPPPTPQDILPSLRGVSSGNGHSAYGYAAAAPAPVRAVAGYH